MSEYVCEAVQRRIGHRRASVISGAVRERTFNGTTEEIILSDKKAHDHGFFKLNAAKQSAMEDSGWLIGVGLGFGDFQTGLTRALEKTMASEGGSERKKLKLPQALNRCKGMFMRAHEKGARVIFIGNGGSAAIASHLAVDYTKNGGIRSIAFNDAATLTCMANDFGYMHVFEKQLEYYGTKKDVAVLISSSGKSQNILNAAKQAMQMEMEIVTLSGMLDDNPLRGLGDVNFYVPSGDYGLVEITHLSLLHSITSITSANI